MGRVHAATWRATGLPVAIKVLPAGASAPARAALERELRMVARMDHRHVVRVYEYGLVEEASDLLPEGSPFLVMQRAEASLAERAPRSWTGVAGVLRAVLAALAHAHAHGVVHRDVKPANVLFLPRAEPPLGVLLADFGIAWTRESTAGHAGSPPYMAPEQVSGQGYGPWTDLYAVGCMAWELVCGAPPFGRDETQEVLRRHLAAPLGDLEPRMEVPDGFEPWVRTLLQRAPARRYQRAADAAWALEILGEAGGAGAPASLSQGATTVAEAAPLDFAWAAEADAREVPVPEPAPFPDTWRDPDPPELSRRVEGLGLDLFSLRELAVIGREEARDRLWAALAAAHEGARPVVALVGPPGIGKSRLARWIARRAHELGAADHLEPGEGPGRRTGIIVLDEDRGPIPDHEGVLVVLTARDRSEAPAGAEILELGSLDPTDTGLLVHELLGLAPDLAAEVEARCKGVPGRAVDLVTELVRRGRLVRTDAGFALREGTSLGTAPRQQPGERSFEELVQMTRAEALAGRPRHVLRWIARARAAAERLGVPGDDPRLGELAAAEIHARAELGQFDRAKELADALAPRAEEHGWVGARAELAIFEGQIAMFQSRHDDAVAHYERAQQLWEQVGDPGRVARAMPPRARLARMAGDDERARELLDRAGAIFEAIGDRDGQALVRRRLGILVYEQGDPEQCARLCREGLDLLGGGWPGRRAELYTSLGHALRDLDRVDEARVAFGHSVQLYDAIGSVDALLARVNLGVCDLEQARWANARATIESTLERMATIAEGMDNPMLNLVASLLLPPLAAAGDWQAFDQRLEEVRAYPGANKVIARWAERAAELCPPERAREVLELARAQWAAVGCEEEAARVAERVRGVRSGAS